MLSELNEGGGEGEIKPPMRLLAADACPSAILDGFITASVARAGEEPELDRWEVRRIGPPRVIVGRTILYRVESCVYG